MDRFVGRSCDVKPSGAVSNFGGGHRVCADTLDRTSQISLKIFESSCLRALRRHRSSSWLDSFVSLATLASFVSKRRNRTKQWLFKTHR